MKMTRYVEPQILAILRQAEGGVPVAKICREHGMMPLPGSGLSANHERECLVLQMAGEVWRHGCRAMSPPPVRGPWRGMIAQTKALEDENRRLKKMFAELSMQNELLKEALGKK